MRKDGSSPIRNVSPLQNLPVFMFTYQSGENRTIKIPFPTHRLASIAQRALTVDKELSSQVQRSIFVLPENTSPNGVNEGFGETAVASNTNDIECKSNGNGLLGDGIVPSSSDPTPTDLRIEYTAATNRLLRVAVNGFFDSLRVVLHTMQELDTDTIDIPGMETLDGVQGVEMV